MNPDRKIALLRSILTASEAQAAKIRAANDEYSATLRQLLDHALARPVDADAGDGASGAAVEGGAR